MEELLIKKVKGGIFGVKNGTKDPAEIGHFLNRLKPLNEGMYDELFGEYQKALENRK